MEAGWRSAALATDTVIVYFRNVVQAFEARWRQLGGKIVAEETYQSLGGKPGLVAERRHAAERRRADVIVTSTAAAFGAQVPILNGLRTLGNNTPILNSWAGDGNYWYTPNPTGHELLLRDVRLGVRRRPGRAPSTRWRQEQGRDREGGLDRWLRHRARSAIDGIVTAIHRAGGSTNGARARRADGEVQERPDALGPGELLDDAAHGVRSAVPRDQECRTTRRRVVGIVKAQGRPEDLGGLTDDEHDAGRDRRPGGVLRAAVGLARVRGRARAPRRHARARIATRSSV